MHKRVAVEGKKVIFYSITLNDKSSANGEFIDIFQVINHEKNCNVFFFMWKKNLSKLLGIFFKNLMLYKKKKNYCNCTCFCVIEDENAIVEGIVTEDGLFDGSVSTAFEEYYFEPTIRYLAKHGDLDAAEEGNTSPAYHTIAYRASDVIEPPQPRKCSSHQLHEGTLDNSIKRSTQTSINVDNFHLVEKIV